MRIKNLFLTAMAIIALSACTNQEIDQVIPDGKLKGYLNLSLTAPQLRTAQTGTTDNSEGNESTISSVSIVLTNSAGVITDFIPKIPVSSNLQVETIQLSMGTHYLYTLVNYDGDPLYGNIQRVIDVADVTDATGGYKNGSFLMVNAFNGENAAGPNGAVEVTINEQHSDKNKPATATVSVDRVAVKISDKTDYVTTAPNVSDLGSSNSLVKGVDIKGFVLLNVNKQFNLVQHWASEGGYAKVLSTPLFKSGGNVSAQYFHHIGAYTQLNKTDGNITSITDMSNELTFKMGPVYTTENRPAFTVLKNGEYTAGKGETTGVIYRVIAKDASGNAVGTFFKYGNTVSKTWSDIAATNPSLQKDIAPGDYPALRAKGVQVYEEGVMYYTYFIKDPNSNHQINGKNYYGVFRNSSYQLKVGKINAIGDDVPGGSIHPVDPTDPNNPTDPTDPTNPPIDREDTYLSVTVEINPWILNPIEIEF